MPIVARLAFEHPLKYVHVNVIASYEVSEKSRKHILMSLHARGLVTDDDLQRAFDEHPELGAA